MLIALLSGVLLLSPTTAPTTAPASRPSAPVGVQRVVADLRREVSQLQATVDSLLKENAALRASNEALKKEIGAKVGLPGIDDKAIQQGITKHELVIGMTLEQATEALKTKCGSPQKFGEERGETTFEWTEFDPANNRIVRTFGMFRNGRLARYEKQ